MEWQTGFDQTDALGTWFQMWIDGFVGILVAILIAGAVAAAIVVIVTLWIRPVARRRFWCSGVDREAEVLFVRRGLFRHLASVASCSAFEACAPTCARRCLDAAYRRQWKSALAPVGHAPTSRAV